MPKSVREQFEQHHKAGMEAKDQGLHQDALRHFQDADLLASEHEDDRKRLDALNPMARAYWSMEDYDEALSSLSEAAYIARRLELLDEQAITISNIGRLLSVRAVRLLPVSEQPMELRESAVPKFSQAFEMLKHHQHLFFRYENASHGSVVAALAGERNKARGLIAEGMAVAYSISAEPYDHKPPAEIRPSGIKQLRAAKFLIPLGNRTPILAAKARSELIR